MDHEYLPNFLCAAGGAPYYDDNGDGTLEVERVLDAQARRQRAK